MMRVVLAIGVAALVCIASVADARRHRAAVVPICNNLDIVNPCPGYMVSGVFKQFELPKIALAPKEIVHKARKHRHKSPVLASKEITHQVATGGRPAGCPHAWCGCWLAAHLGLSDRSLWAARRWALIGHPAGGPQAGAVVVWRHHVGLIKAVEGNRILVLSGNDGRAVRERWRRIFGVIAYRIAQ